MAIADPQRNALFNELSGRVHAIKNVEAQLKFLQDMLIVSAIGINVLFGPRVALNSLVALLRWTLKDPDLLEQADAEAEVLAGVTIQ